MKILKKILKYLLFFVLFFVSVFSVLTFLFWLFKTPLKNAEWQFGQQKVQQVVFDGQQIVVKDLRDYDWTKIGYEENYSDFEFHLSDIESLEVGVSHFSPREGIGHVFLVFNLTDGRNLALSIESRREKGEAFTLTGGLTYQYELIYILATKEDLLLLREKRNERVYIYPIKIEKEKIKNLFLLISKKVNLLYDKPEFYHIIFKNCTNLVTDEVNKISDKNFPLYERTFAPGYTARALFKMSLIDTDLKNFEAVRKKFIVEFK